MCCHPCDGFNSDVTPATHTCNAGSLPWAFDAHGPWAWSREDALKRFLLIGAAIVLGSSPAFAQVTPAAGFVPPDDTQSLRVGITLFADNTYTLNPKGLDADCAATPGCTANFTPSAFNVVRTYLNVTGNLSHIVSYRITPDIAGLVAGTSYPFRLK